MSYKVVSSAYRSAEICFVYCGKSLINSKNNSGPRLDPRKTQLVMYLESD